ncbi:MAG: SagB/ThcOx family dehydrogenase [Promethearchaeota archaeon]
MFLIIYFMEKDLDNYGDYFQQKSKYSRGKLPQHYLDWSNKPETYKTYPNAIKKIILPKPQFDNSIKFWDVIKNRKSTRKFKKEQLSLEQLSLLLFGMSGLTRVFPQFTFRTIPSAGGLFPIEIYPVVLNIKGIDPGIYHYNIREHNLEMLKSGDFSIETAKGCLDQMMVVNSNVTFILTAVIERSKWKYLQRCYRYLYLDAGHIGQNFYLVAESLGLGAFTIGAIYDDELNKLLDIDGINETTLYVAVVGKK